jgi:carbonic anhydrase
LYQSPIDINTHKTVLRHYPLFIFSEKYQSNELFKLINNGHQVAATLADRTYGQSEKDLWFTGGGIKGIFYFVNFHLHWGRNDRHGSEHEIDGHRFPAEAHVVFKNKETGQLAVFAFLFTVTDHDHEENTEWKKYADAASQLIHVNDTMFCTFNLSQLMQVKERQYFRYMGSLTTPPCTEGVIWTIFTNTIPIKEESLNKLRQDLMRKVYRPVQSINDRSIFENR